MTAPSPDLASILQTLSAYAPQQPQPQPLYSSNQTPHEDEYDPSQYDPALTLALQSNLTRPSQHHQTQPDPSSQASSIYHTAPENLTPPTTSHSKPSTPIPAGPPSTIQITTYAAALRHITTYLLPLPHFKPRIQHLISSQHKHERQWHAGRQNLLTQLEGRESSRAKLNAVLASIGGGGGSAGGGGGKAGNKIAGSGSIKGQAQDGAKVEGQELKTYDRKVWKAQREMVRATGVELGKVGVPFFGVEVETNWEGKEKELRELRERVLALLEDLCGEEEG